MQKKPSRGNSAPPFHATGFCLFRQAYFGNLPMHHALFLACNCSEPSPIIFPCFFPPRLDRFPRVALHCGPPLFLIFLCNAARNRNAFRSTLRFSSTDPCGCLSVSCADHPSGRSSSSSQRFSPYLLRSFSTRMAVNAIVEHGQSATTII